MHNTDHLPYSIRIDEEETAGVVAVEPAGPFVRVFRRSSNGVTFRDYPFKPFMLVADPALLARSPVFTIKHQLEGDGGLRWFVQTVNWHDWCLLRDYLQQSARPEIWFGIPDVCRQFLVASGITFFRELPWHKVSTLCISVATEDRKQQPARREEQRNLPITAVGVTDADGYEELITTDAGLTEQEILQRLSAIIRERDPDLLTGYRCSDHDLPCLVRRAGYYGIRLRLGRDGSEPHQLQGSDLHRRQKGFGVYGRSVIDTVQLVRQYERQVAPLPGYALPQVAAWFGCSVRHDPALPSIIADLRETTRIYRKLAPAWHIQTQQYPAGFQTVTAKAGASVVAALLLKEQLQKNCALPVPVQVSGVSEQRTGELFRKGQAGPVVMCDIAELAASIMLAYRIAPRGEIHDLFLRLLCRQREYDHQPEVYESGARLLPAWFELLCRPRHPLSDPYAAGEVKRLMRVITGDLLGWLREQGAEPLFADQQVICFVPPAGQSGEQTVAGLNRRLTELLPGAEPIRCSGQYRSIFVYSLSNYALLEQNGTLVYRGHGFAYHSMEPFLLEFLKQSLAQLLDNRPDEVRVLHGRYLRRLVAHDVTLNQLMRTETLADTLKNYQQAVHAGKRNRAAVYELALSVPEAWQVGDTISYYVAGNSKQVAAHESCRFAADFDPAHPDLNIPWYVERLHHLFKRLEPFLPTEPTLF